MSVFVPSDSPKRCAAAAWSSGTGLARVVRLRRRRRADDARLVIPVGGEDGGAGGGEAAGGGVLSGGATGGSSRRGRGVGAGVRTAGVPMARREGWPAVERAIPRPKGAAATLVRLVLVPRGDRSRGSLSAPAVGAPSRVADRVFCSSVSSEPESLARRGFCAAAADWARVCGRDPRVVTGATWTTAVSTGWANRTNPC